MTWLRISRPVVVLALGQGPGAALPFVATYALETREADLFFLALSSALMAMNVVALNVEASALGAIGRAHQGVSNGKRRLDLRAVRSQALVSAVVPALLGALAFGGLFASLGIDRAAVYMSLVAFLLFPFAAAFAATSSAACLYAGRTDAAIASHSFRSLLPIALLLLPFGVNIITLAVAYVLGELLRGLVLFRIQSAPLSHLEPHAPGVTLPSMRHQFLTSGLTQLSPLTDRVILSRSNVGDVAAYELSDKVSFAALQAVYSLLLIRMAAGWSRASAVDLDVGLRQFRDDLRKLVFFTGVMVAVGATAALYTLHMNWIPVFWERGVAWGAVALFSIPAAVVMTACLRFLAVVGKTRVALGVTVFGVALNILLDLVLYSLFGGIGVVIASVPTKMVVAFLLLRKVGSLAR